jgi:hypothetical protein
MPDRVVFYQKQKLGEDSDALGVHLNLTKECTKATGMSNVLELVEAVPKPGSNLGYKVVCPMVVR